MTDTARLQIRVESLEAELAKRRLDTLARKGDESSKAVSGLGRSFKALTPILASVGGLLGARAIIDYSDQFTNLENNLRLAIDEHENLETTLSSVFDLAQETRSSVADISDLYFRFSKATEELAFNQGQLLEITETVSKAITISGVSTQAAQAAITQFGQGLSAGALRGQEFNSVVEQAPRLAQILTDSLGLTIGQLRKMAEQGELTRKVVIKALVDQAETIDKEFSKTEATISQNSRKLANSTVFLIGAFDDLSMGSKNVGEVIGVLSDSFDSLTDSIKSGEFAAELDALGGKFLGFGNDVVVTADIISNTWDELMGESQGGMAFATNVAVDSIIDSFKNLPENIRAVVQLMAVDLAAMVDQGKFYGEAFVDVVGSELSALAQKAGAFGTAILQSLNPLAHKDFNLKSSFEEIDKVASDMSKRAFSRAEDQLEISRNARLSSIEGILEEREVALSSFDAQIAKADDLRKTFEEQAKSRRAIGGGNIEQFGQLETGQDGETKAERKTRETRQKQREKEFENLRMSLRSEEESIQESYNNRLKIILENTEKGSVAQQDLRSRLDEQFAADAIGDLATPDTFEEQLSQLEDFYNARRELILNNSAITEEQRTELESELTKQRNEKLAALENQRLSTILSTSGQLFGDLAEISKGFAGEQSDLYRVMFAASKAFAVADSIVKIQQGIASAASLPFPANLGAIGSVVSATAGIISTINGTQFAGAFDNGGMIPSGQVGLVGEFGPELIQGPANITSRKETAKMFNEMTSGGESASQQKTENNIKVVNVLDPSTIHEALSNSEGEQVIMNAVKRNSEQVKRWVS